MATKTGTVSRISVNPSWGCVTINPGSHLMLLWSYTAQPDNATNRLLHANYLAIARDAFIHGRTIEVSHKSGSALVDSVAVT